MHVSFINILLSQFLMDDIVNDLIYKVCHLCLHLGTLDTRVRDDFGISGSGKVSGISIMMYGCYLSM